MYEFSFHRSLEQRRNRNKHFLVCFQAIMQLNDLEQEDEEFQNFLKQVKYSCLLFLMYYRPSSTRQHYQKRLMKISRQRATKNVSASDLNQVETTRRSNK